MHLVGELRAASHDICCDAQWTGFAAMNQALARPSPLPWVALGSALALLAAAFPPAAPAQGAREPGTIVGGGAVSMYGGGGDNMT